MLTDKERKILKNVTDLAAACSTLGERAASVKAARALWHDSGMEILAARWAADDEAGDSDVNPFHPESPEGRAWDRGEFDADAANAQADAEDMEEEDKRQRGAMFSTKRDA